MCTLSRRAYLAGPDVFLPQAREQLEAKVAICARHGIVGVPPLDEAIEAALSRPADEAWRLIFAADLRLMEGADLAIANLTPFRGASADAGTLVELGWFLGRGKPAFGYSNCATPFEARSRAQRAAVPDPVPGLAVEGFGLADNLMMEGALLAAGELPLALPEADLPFDSLEVFERLVAAVSAQIT